MSVKIINFPFILIALAACGGAFSIRYFFPHVSDGAIYASAAGFAVALDMLWRATKGKRHWFEAKNGGCFASLPLWVLGTAWLALVAYQTYRGPLPSFIQAATTIRK